MCRVNPTLSAALVFAALCCTACRPQPSSERIAGETMGTTYDVTVTLSPDGIRRSDLESTIDAVLDGINRHLSTYDPSSEISRFNANPSIDWIPVSTVLLDAVTQSEQVSLATNGAFDITVGPIVRAWGFGSSVEGATDPPGGEQVERLRAATGHDKLEARVDPPALRKSLPALQIDVDGIAPGIAVDRIAERFEALGIRDYLVELGGEVRARGLSPAGRAWRVAIEAPVAGERRPHALLELDGFAVSTSGDYRDFRVTAGRRVSHTIDPRTAAPVTHRLTSVTVVHASAAVADAFSTALMVLGPDEGMDVARRLGLAALFITRSPGEGSFFESQTPEFARFRRPLP
jgi:thiamine biosynthesis lipoprotein